MRRLLVVLGTCVGVLVAGPATAGPTVAAAGPEGLQIAGVGSAPGGGVSLVASVQPTPPASSPTFSVTAGGATLPASVSPVLSGETPVQFVVDAQTVAAATSLLLQLPPGSPTEVVAAARSPRVVAPLAPGVADDVRALSALDVGSPDAVEGAAIGKALNLALRRKPGPPSVLALFTAAPDAGGESVASLAARIRKAGSVIAVVTTSASGYWPQVASATGGVAVRADPRREVPASDQLAGALRSRYRIGFDRPPSGDVAELRLAGGAATRFTLPPQPASRTEVWWILGAVEVAGVLALGVVLLLRRRERRLVDMVDDVVPVDPMPGVRVFDLVDSGAPLDVTNSLFEPRAVRDARERAATEPPEEPAPPQQPLSEAQLPGGPRHGPSD